MAWPTTDASTAALDSGTDDPNLARPQIKLNIENANAIKNEFGTVDISSPQNEQVLQYNATSGKWVNATISTGAGTSTIALLTSAGFKTAESIDGVFRNPIEITETSDLGNIVSVGAGSDNDELVFASGTYELQLTRIDRLNNTNSQRVELANITSNSILLTALQDDDQFGLSGVFTSNGSDTMKFVYRSSSITGNMDYIFRVAKLA